MSMSEAEARAEGRREAAPVAFVALVVMLTLALVSWSQGWELVGLSWWVWLIVGLPVLLLTIDLTLTLRGVGLVRTRRAALALLGLLVLGNFVALAILVAALVTTNTRDLGGGELLLTAFTIYTTNVIVFGLLFWELDSGGPDVRLQQRERTPVDFLFPQDGGAGPDASTWRPQAWDFLYVSLTNSIAFSPTDTMPLTVRTKVVMGLESAISAVTILLVAARAVNVLGS
jgi:uncharacterized membrane protein